MVAFRNAFQRLMGQGAEHLNKGDEPFKASYAQCGEDLITDFVLGACVKTPLISYLDIGAHHPARMSNTYLFYLRGGRGVCVEPDPDLFAEFIRVRPRDTSLNIGIGAAGADQAEFFRMTTPTLNTFSRETAERYASYGNQKIEEVVELPLVPINSILADHFERCPNFVSLDVEGYDMEILAAFDFSRFRPEVFCIETLTYTEDRSEKKIQPIVDLMIANGYFAYADTYINTIFVERESWRNR